MTSVMNNIIIKKYKYKIIIYQTIRHCYYIIKSLEIITAYTVYTWEDLNFFSLHLLVNATL